MDQKKHYILGHPIFFAFLVAIVPILLSSLMGTLIAKVFNALLSLGLDRESGMKLSEFLSDLVKLVFVMLMIVQMKKAYGDRFRFGFSGENLKKSFILTSPVLFMAVSNIPEYLMKGGTLKSGLPLAVGILAGFTPGLFEEVALRGCALSNMMIQWKDQPNKIYKALFWSGSVFGILHLMNLSHAGVAETLMQVGYAAGAGFLFGGAYLRSKNLVGLSICHALVDITAQFFLLPENAPEVIPFTVFTSAVITIGGIGLGLYLVRKEKQPEILELFDAA